MRFRSALATILVGSSFAAAHPPTDAPPPEDPYEPAPIEEAPADPAPTPTEPAPTEPPIVTAPPGAVPPITINITNNNTGNNSNTNTQTNTAPVNVSTPVDVATTTSTPVTVSTPVTTTTTTTLTPPTPPPLLVDRGRHPTIERVAIVAPRKPPRWLTLGVTGGEDGPGLRASIDIFRRGRFAIGIAASAKARHGFDDDGDDHDGPEEIERDGEHGGRDHRMGSHAAVAYLAYTRQFRRLQVRAHVGFGVECNRGDDDDRDDDASDGTGTIARTVGGDDRGDEGERTRRRGSPRAEAGLLVALPIGKRLALVAGPVVSATHRENDDDNDTIDLDLDGDRHRHEKPDIDARFMAGIRLAF
jgi:hypothetical protein